MLPFLLLPINYYRATLFGFYCFFQQKKWFWSRKKRRESRLKTPLKCVWFRKMVMIKGLSSYFFSIHAISMHRHSPTFDIESMWCNCNANWSHVWDCFDLCFCRCDKYSKQRIRTTKNATIFVTNSNYARISVAYNPYSIWLEWFFSHSIRFRIHNISSILGPFIALWKVHFMLSLSKKSSVSLNWTNLQAAAYFYGHEIYKSMRKNFTKRNLLFDNKIVGEQAAAE